MPLPLLYSQSVGLVVCTSAMARNPVRQISFLLIFIPTCCLNFWLCPRISVVSLLHSLPLTARCSFELHVDCCCYMRCCCIHLPGQHCARWIEALPRFVKLLMMTAKNGSQESGKISTRPGVANVRMPSIWAALGAVCRNESSSNNNNKKWNDKKRGKYSDESTKYLTNINEIKAEKCRQCVAMRGAQLMYLPRLAT